MKTAKNSCRRVSIKKLIVRIRHSSTQCLEKWTARERKWGSTSHINWYSENWYFNGFSLNTRFRDPWVIEFEQRESKNELVPATCLFRSRHFATNWNVSSVQKNMKMNKCLLHCLILPAAFSFGITRMPLCLRQFTAQCLRILHSNQRKNRQIPTQSPFLTA